MCGLTDFPGEIKTCKNRIQHEPIQQISHPLNFILSDLQDFPH